jgi:hypothetical protein
MSKATKTKRHPHMGGTFHDFLREEGIYEAVQTAAMKRILAMCKKMCKFRRKFAVKHCL